MNVCIELYRFLNVSNPPEPGKIVITSWHHPHRSLFVKWFLESYEPPRRRVALILPCSNVKPYSRSRIRIQLYTDMTRERLWSCVQIYTLSDLLGLVPQEVEDCYPVANYEFPPSALGSLRTVLVAIVASELRKIARYHEKIVAWLPSKHMDIIDRAARAVGIDVEMMSYGRLAFHTMKLLIDRLKQVCRE